METSERINYLKRLLSKTMGKYYTQMLDTEKRIQKTKRNIKEMPQSSKLRVKPIKSMMYLIPIKLSKIEKKWIIQSTKKDSG